MLIRDEFWTCLEARILLEMAANAAAKNGQISPRLHVSCQCKCKKDAENQRSDIIWQSRGFYETKNGKLVFLIVKTKEHGMLSSVAANSGR